jgi:hypothetical protein
MKPAQQGRERRQFGRRQTRFQGWIHLPGRSRISCFVSNISQTGARIELLDDIFLPYKFQLDLPDHQVRVDCEVRHTGHRCCGVQFCASTPVDTTSRVKKLLLTDADHWRG